MRAVVVDDSQFLRERLKAILAPLDWVCAEAGDGAAAVSLLSGVCGFDLMLLDINMPVMDGLTCLQRVRAMPALAAMKIMMVTTEADATFIERALAAGADEFLMKPMSADSMHAKLLLLGLGGNVNIHHSSAFGQPAVGGV